MTLAEARSLFFAQHSPRELDGLKPSSFQGGLGLRN